MTKIAIFGPRLSKFRSQVENPLPKIFNGQNLSKTVFRPTLAMFSPAILVVARISKHEREIFERKNSRKKIPRKKSREKFARKNSRKKIRAKKFQEKSRAKNSLKKIRAKKFQEKIRTKKFARKNYFVLLEVLP